MPSSCRFSYKDYDGEISHVTFAIAPITGANLDAQNTAVNTLSTAILALQEENSLQSKEIVAVNNFISRAKAATKPCQRETKWLVTIEDATLHTLSRHELPQAKLSLLATDSDMIDLATDPGLAFKTAVEATVKAPKTGNAVNLISVQHVGRNL